MTLEPYIFFVTLVSASTFSGYKFYMLYRLMKLQTGIARPILELSSRIRLLFTHVLGQTSVFADPYIGMIHTAIFWGFLIITTGTIEQFGATLFPGFSFSFLGPTLYHSLIALQDVFTLFVLVGVLLAAHRRLILRPKHLGQSQDANKILVITGSLMVCIFLMNGFYLLSYHQHLAPFMPASQQVAHGLNFLNFSAEQNLFWGHVFRWLHMLLVLGFGMYIPTSKHLHIVASGPNIFLKHLPHAKGMRKIDFETESTIGAAKITDLSWKDTLDLYSCTECGRCEAVCPAYLTGKPLSPKKLIIDLKHNLYQQRDHILAQKPDQVGPIIDAHVTQDVIWACTSCRACEIACPVFIEHTDKIFDIRKNLVMVQSSFPQEVGPVFRNIETNATPWAFSGSDRAAWSEGLDIPKIADNPQAEVLFWVGCAGSFDERNKKVAKALVSILKKANISFAILGNEEQCTGDPARRMGNEFLFQTLAQANVETLQRYQVKKIVTACPHCFNTLKNEYPSFGGHFEVLHHSMFIAHLIQEGKLKPQAPVTESVTFHDSCYLGRWNNVYGSPRQVLQHISQEPLQEMEQHHEKGLCCGAGGGRMFMEETIGSRINVTRTEQALKTGAQVVASSCPFCLTMLGDGIKTKNAESSLVAKDIAELLDATT